MVSDQSFVDDSPFGVSRINLSRDLVLLFPIDDVLDGASTAMLTPDESQPASSSCFKKIFCTLRRRYSKR